jgi:hypothetical protein
MKKVFLLSLAASGAGFALAPSDSHACRCMPPRAMAERLFTYQGVFYGKAVSARTSGNPYTGYRHTKFEIKRIWKGDFGRTVTVRSNKHPTACGTSFVNGASYLVFTSKINGTWSTSMCSFNVPGRAAAGPMSELGAGWWAPPRANGTCPQGTANSIRCIRAPCPVRCTPVRR